MRLAMVMNTGDEERGRMKDGIVQRIYEDVFSWKTSDVD